MQYEHTQTAPLYLLVLATGIAMFVGAWSVPEQIVQIILVASGVLMFVLVYFFRHLTVSDEGNRLLISFGPLPLFRRRVVYSDIETVEQARFNDLGRLGHPFESKRWMGVEPVGF